MKINDIELGNTEDILKKNQNFHFLDCCWTSPPYFQTRTNNNPLDLANEEYQSNYIYRLQKVFLAIKLMLKDTGTLWVNIGDTVEDGKFLDIPFKLKQGIQNLGFKCINSIIWYKPNALPRPFKNRFGIDYEYVFLFAKTDNYYFNPVYEKYTESTQKKIDKGDTKALERITFGGKKHLKNDNSLYNGRTWKPNPKGRLVRSVWSIPISREKGDHLSLAPVDLVQRCIINGCPPRGIVFDPYMGYGTTAIAALKNNRRFMGIELDPNHLKAAKKRIEKYMSSSLDDIVAESSVGPGIDSPELQYFGTVIN